LLKYLQTVVSHALAVDLGLSTSSQIRILTRRGRGSSSRRIEGPDREFAARQRSPFIAIHGRKLARHVGKDRREFLGSLTLCR
jgi:hypothetical protein